ncbi:MAG: hypothetical protein EP330_22265 [Deltaproteobacteria bacterium]|nr:MAG: hypothetical protein EP330_22265 [Deltaproteobacteria bacterium]
MRASSSLIALLVLGCGPKTAVVDAAAVSAPVDIEAACPTTPPTGYRVERGEGAGASAAVALAAAREAATQRLVMGACAGLADSRCDALRRQVKPWKEGHFDASTQSACASVAVEKSALDAIEREKAALDAALAVFAGKVAATGASVDPRPPRWHTGCPSGLAGARLLALVRNALADAGVATTATGAALWLDLVPGPDAVTLTASLEDGGPIEGFAFAPDLLGFDPSETGSCRGDGDLGLVGGERPGAGGLRVSVRLPADDGVLCEGKETEPVVAVNRPSRVQVYSVSRDGRSLLVWPPPGGDDTVTDSLSLGALTAVAQADGSDERLVALAVDARETFASTAGWQGFCEVSGGLGPDHYPEGAAIGTASLHVLEAGTGSCPDVPGIAEKRAALFSPPTCE